MKRFFTIASVFFLSSTPVLLAADVNSLIREGDTAYARRAEGQEDGRGVPSAVTKALDAYQTAVTLEPENLEARWKLAQALNFRGVYVEQDKKTKQMTLTESRDIGEKSVQLIQKLVSEKLGKDLSQVPSEEKIGAYKTVPHAAEIFMTLGLSWGEWGLAHGKLAAAKKGVAGKIRDLAELVIAVDPTVENAGGHRLLGRLHYECPKIPLVTGWVSKQKSLENLKKAYEIAPNHLFNKQFYAEILYDSKEDRPKALALLQEVAAAKPDPQHLLEDMRAVRESKEFLEKTKN